MALLWLGLNGLDLSSWIIGVPTVAASAWVSLMLFPVRVRLWSLRAAIEFFAFFLRKSLRGGWDVAWRALSPTPGLTPALVCFPLHLPRGSARMFFCGVVSLLPGTAVVAIEERSICLHVLVASPRVEMEVRDLERRVAKLFGARLLGEQEAS